MMKYKSKPVWYLPDSGIEVFSKGEIPPNTEYIYFPSKFEYEVYRILLSQGFKVELQKVVNLKFTNWRVDFFLPEHNLLIEAKGMPTEAFKIKLKAFNYFYPYKSIWIVKSLSELKANLAKLPVQTKLGV